MVVLVGLWQWADTTKTVRSHDRCTVWSHDQSCNAVSVYLLHDTDTSVHDTRKTYGCMTRHQGPCTGSLSCFPILSVIYTYSPLATCACKLVARTEAMILLVL